LYLLVVWLARRYIPHNYKGEFGCVLIMRLLQKIDIWYQFIKPRVYARWLHVKLEL